MSKGGKGHGGKSHGKEGGISAEVDWTPNENTHVHIQGHLTTTEVVMASAAAAGVAAKAGTWVWSGITAAAAFLAPVAVPILIGVAAVAATAAVGYGIYALHQHLNQPDEPEHTTTIQSYNTTPWWTSTNFSTTTTEGTTFSTMEPSTTTTTTKTTTTTRAPNTSPNTTPNTTYTAWTEEASTMQNRSPWPQPNDGPWWNSNEIWKLKTQEREGDEDGLTRESKLFLVCLICAILSTIMVILLVMTFAIVYHSNNRKHLKVWAKIGAICVVYLCVTAMLYTVSFLQIQELKWTLIAGLALCVIAIPVVTCLMYVAHQKIRRLTKD